MIKYKKKFGTTLMLIEGKFLIQDEHDLYQVNEVAARIFSLCDGENTDSQMINTLSKFYNEEIIEVEEAVREFLNDLVNMELIKAI